MRQERVKSKAVKFPAAIYVAVSEPSMQAIDFTWLTAQGFVFHHYRAPGHGDDAEGGGASEFVYYCWPTGTGSADDMVPVYATSIEGVSGVLLSGATEEKVLLVWERGSWSTPAGAVNAGESKIDAIAREVRYQLFAAAAAASTSTYCNCWAASFLCCMLCGSVMYPVSCIR